MDTKTVKAQKLKELNNELKKINKERATREGARNSLLSQLKSKLKEYGETYNIAIDIDNVEEANRFARAELERVSEQQKKEYDKAQKLVDMYHAGNILGMRKALGLDEEPVDFVVQVESDEEPSPTPAKVKPAPTPVTVAETEEDDEYIFADDDDILLDDDDIVAEEKPANTKDMDAEEDEWDGLNDIDFDDMDVDW